MKTLLFSAFAAAVTAALLAGSPGCTSSCDVLDDICDRCTDADYRTTCEATVSEGDSAVCNGRLGTYETFCPELGEGGAGGGVGDPCQFGESSCNGSCTDLLATAATCGSCSNACADGEVCGAGTCVGTCPATLPDLCADTQGCVDTTSDPLNCGACGTVCDAGQVCTAGVCSDSCVAPTPTECEGACVNLAQSPLHCGLCGNPCAAGELCVSGVCAADCGTLTQCCGKCVDPASDPAHCGGCDPSCLEVAGGAPSGAVCDGDGQVCSNGTCKDDCDSNLDECLGSCVDLQTDLANCGECGNLCMPGAVCDGGSCSAGGCSAGKTDCGGACADLGSDHDNCGACGNACEAAEHCSLGTCAAVCADGLTSCGGDCVALDSDPNHCGSCVESCSGTKPKCQAGVCKKECDSTHTDCGGGQCVDPASMDSNLLHCGGCGNNCGDNSVCTADFCSAGQCSNVSGGALCNDGNGCTQDKCDPIAGCQSVAYTQQEFVALCNALGQPPGFNAATQCLYCNPVASSPCAASNALPDTTMAPNPAAQCTNPPPSGATCGTCVFQNGTPTCDTALAQPCIEM